MYLNFEANCERPAWITFFFWISAGCVFIKNRNNFITLWNLQALTYVLNCGRKNLQQHTLGHLNFKKVLKFPVHYPKSE